MALSQSALSELLEAFRTGDGVDMIRESVRTVLQELVEFEAAGVIGAERYERTEDRVTERNGTRPKLLATKAGDIELRIPELRKGSYFPSILEPRRRIDQALYAVVMEAYVHGISTRSVDDLVVALGADSGISKSEVSRICEQLDESVGAFRTRPLDHIAFPYVYLDATYLHVRNKPGKGGQVVSMAVVVATGIAADGSGLAASTVRVIHGIVSFVFLAAVRDRRLTTNPCEGTRLPIRERRLVVPLRTEQVTRLRAEVPHELRALVNSTAGTGMRQGEVSGVTRDRLRLDGSDPVVIVDRQLRTLPGPTTEFGPLKTSSSRRVIPLPRVVVTALGEHLRTYDRAEDSLVFTLAGRPIVRSAFGHV